MSREGGTAFSPLTLFWCIVPCVYIIFPVPAPPRVPSPACVILARETFVRRRPPDEGRVTYRAEDDGDAIPGLFWGGHTWA